MLHSNRSEIDDIWSKTSKFTYQCNLVSNIFFASFFTYSLITIASKNKFLMPHFNQFNMVCTSLIGFAALIILILTICQAKKDWKDSHPPDLAESLIPKIFSTFLTMAVCVLFKVNVSGCYDLSKTAIGWSTIIACCFIIAYCFILNHLLSAKKNMLVIIVFFIIQNTFIILK